MTERIIADGALELCAETFGDSTHPSLLLIMGAQASMLWWPRPFCEALAARGFHVIRYDHRDVGRSTTYGPGQAPYTIHDLIGDVFRVLDGLKIDKAHLVGFSMGGYLAQGAAIAEPQRVASLTIWGAGPLDAGDDLPGMDPALLDFLMSAFPQDWSDEAAVIDFHVEGQRRMAGPRHSFDEAAQRALAEAEFRRARDRASALNHATYDTSHPGGARGISAPTLIVHGAADPVTPLAHAHALADQIDGAHLLVLDGVGHELHPATWPGVIEAIVENTRRAA